MNSDGRTEAQAVAAIALALNEIEASGIGWKTPEHGVKEMFNEAKRASFFGDKYNFRRYNPVRKCAFLDCAATGEDVSENSHVLAKQSSLFPLVDNPGKPIVLQPNLRSSQPESMRKIDLKEASTFIGYCEKHEGDFTAFETDKRLRTASHYMLQLMRSAARELWRKQIFIDGLFDIADLYATAIDKLPGATDETKRYWFEKIVDPLVDLRIHAEIQWSRLFSIHIDLTKNLDEDKLPDWVASIEYDSKLRVALSGSSLNHFEQGAPMYVMAIFPNRDKTLLLLASSKDDALPVQRYAKEWLDTDASRDATVRAWMGHTDHWFTSPKWWNECFPTSDREAILRQLTKI